MARGRKAATAEDEPVSHGEFEGQVITRHRVGLYAAQDLKFEDRLKMGDWVEVTIRGKVEGVEIEPAAAGVARKAKVTVKSAEIGRIAEPPEIDGQMKLASVPPDVQELAEGATRDPDSPGEFDVPDGETQSEEAEAE